MSDRLLPTDALAVLEGRRQEFGKAAATAKHVALDVLEPCVLKSAALVTRLHESLCFLAAYPDDDDMLRRVRIALASFADRRDLRRHREELENSGIAGTTIRFAFFGAMAAWLARRWPDRLAIDWDGFERADELERWLPILALYPESPAIDECALDLRQWLERLKRKDETDGAFIARRFADLPMSEFAREILWDRIDSPMILAPGPGGPSRTEARFAGSRITFQRRPLTSGRPVLPDAILVPPRSIRPVRRADAERLIDLAREAMVTRNRDLDAFAHADPSDVRMIDCGDGLQFAAMGVRPERRLLLEAVYGFLTLKNGVPIGYVLTSSLYGSCEIAYNVFETFRGGEAAHVYGRVLAMCGTLFAADSFTIYPYQLGDDNEEAIASGAWWFYQKLGFRARDQRVLALMNRELGRMRENPRHRSSPPTLRKLASQNVYYHAERQRDDVIGLLPLADIGLAVVDLLSARYGSDRERSRRECADQVASALGVAARRGFTAPEQLAWERWAPLVLALGAERWPEDERLDLAAVIRAKGARRESEFVLRFDRHARLRKGLLRLAARG